MADIRIGGLADGLAIVGRANQGGGANPVGDSGFGDMVRQALNSTVEAQQKAETLSTQAVNGKADVTEIVTAVTNAELALDTAIAVRDKVINAYQEIMRMPI
ncbi:flagellar hook-basal body complex protein FliE [Ferrovibrio sp. MS7]|uniref:flagellar hook-basal body complex protein FliE n=1 Tax=Ferrovibrio plantarum TaxID=3119164 RepID=UPI00313490F7